MPIRVDSEIGRLRRVLVHRPGREIDWMVPAMMGSLLFDDILDGDEAREEHDLFVEVLRQAEVGVLDAQNLLADVLAHPGPRKELLDELEAEYSVPFSLVHRLEELPPQELAAALIEGIRAPADISDAGRLLFFQLNPVPNYFFQRDPQVVLGNRVVVSSMATDAREREPLLARTLFEHHPDLAGAAALFEIDVPPSGAPQHNPHFPYPNLEGGDVLVVSPEIVLVGLSERTNRRGIEVLAEYLRLEETPFRHLLMVELPRRRSYMHLDTVFTLIDRNLCLAYLPVIEPGGPESAHVYSVDLYAKELTFTLRPSLLKTLADFGLDLEVVPCGGASEAIDQQREQWTDGANAFAVAPGLIFLYRRNRRTIEELARRGWRVLPDEEVAAGKHDLLGGGPAVVSLCSNELSRARGGPRCMTMPIERDPL
ncbi:MAG TPA: arginine deiminase family protein [Thermoanaerobaculia bacterium]|jgi:arginine deiminase|nr:arginine deiminase family protein [Thermoanaerobaculia bacterium]